MAVVAHVLPRHWDGRRLLRFLTGLAMLGLAFAAPVAAEAVPPAPVVITAAASAVAAAPAVIQVPAPVSAPSLPVTLPPVILAALILIPAGLVLRVRAERAPPAAV